VWRPPESKRKPIAKSLAAEQVTYELCLEAVSQVPERDDEASDKNSWKSEVRPVLRRGLSVRMVRAIFIREDRVSSRENALRGFWVESVDVTWLQHPVVYQRPMWGTIVILKSGSRTRKQASVIIWLRTGGKGIETTDGRKMA
jgi:hypothetical protein